MKLVLDVSKQNEIVVKSCKFPVNALYRTCLLSEIRWMHYTLYIFLGWMESYFGHIKKIILKIIEHQ